MALHFRAQEYERRQRETRARMEAWGLDGLVLFEQESMCYLTGYDTAGYTMFQAMYIGADGSNALLTRSADAYQAAFTSLVKDVRVWVDREGATPGVDLRDLLEGYGCRGKRLGVEYHALRPDGAARQDGRRGAGRILRARRRLRPRPPCAPGEEPGGARDLPER